MDNGNPAPITFEEASAAAPGAAKPAKRKYTRKFKDSPKVSADFDAKLRRSERETGGQRRRLSGYRAILDGCGVKVGPSGPEGAEDNSKTAHRVPLYYLWKQMLVPALLERDPQFVVRPRDVADPREVARARLMELYIGEVFRRQRVRENVVRYSLSDAVDGGLGIAETDFDSVRGEPRVTYLPVDDVSLDMDGRHPDIRFVRWSCISECLPLATAQARFPGIEFCPDHVLRDASRNDKAGGYDSISWSSSDAEKAGVEAFVTVRRVFIHGDDPYTDAPAEGAPDASKVDAPDGDTEYEGALYEGKTAVLFFAYARAAGAGGTSGYPVRLRLIDVRAWPFLPDRPGFPLSFLRLTHDAKSFWPRSIFDPLRAVVDDANEMANVEVIDAKRSLMRKILYNAKHLSAEDATSIMSNPENLSVHGLTNVPDGTPLKSLVDILNFSNPDRTARQLSDLMVGRFEMSVRVGEMSQEARSHESAASATVRAQRSDMRMDVPASFVEEFLEDIGRKIALCGIELATEAQVERVVGRSAMGWREEKVTDAATGIETGSVVQRSLWPGALDGLDRANFAESISIKPGSARKIDRQAAAQDIALLKQDVLASTNAAAALGVGPDPGLYVSMLYGLDRRKAEILGLSDLAVDIPLAGEIYVMGPPAAAGDGASADGQQSSEAVAGDTKAREAAASMGAVQGGSASG